ncbi:hypothetical protein AAG906_001123 [Vitis piasezkii]
MRHRIQREDFSGRTTANCYKKHRLDRSGRVFANTSDIQIKKIGDFLMDGCNYGDACFPNRYGFSKSSFNPLKWQNRCQKLTKYWQLKVIPKCKSLSSIGRRKLSKRYKTKLYINEPLMKTTTLPSVRNFHGIASKPSHNIHTLRNLKVLANHPLRKSPQRLFGY